LILAATTESIRFSTSNANSVDWSSAWADKGVSALTPGGTAGNVAAASTVTIVSAPAASTYRKITSMRWVNRGTTSVTIQVMRTVSGTDYYLDTAYSLAPGSSLVYADASGTFEVVTAPSVNSVGTAADFSKVITAPEAIGEHYLSAKDGNFPAAISIGAPGMAGRVVSGAGNGSDGGLVIPNPAAGSNYITSAVIAASVVQFPYLLDLLWVQTGIAVTTLTAQTVNSVAFPARDVNGSSDGAGVRVGVLVTTATTNAGTSTVTISYTNSAGVAGRTGTAVVATTAAVGSLFWFSLQSGDVGVRSVQTVTIATSLVTGAVSLIAARKLAAFPVTVVNVGFALPLGSGGVRLHNDSCVHLALRAAAASVTTFEGIIQVEER
jgi:hypothetical protein